MSPARLVPSEGQIEAGAVPSGTSHLSARPPCEGDAAEIWRLVEGCDALDTNSPYAYLLLCTDFAHSGLVLRRHSGAGATTTPGGGSPSTDTARDDAGEDEKGELVGFVLGYLRPERPDTYFVWQIGVAAAARGQGMGRRLLDIVMDRAAAEHDVRFLEATVTPSNTASRMLFTNFARDRGAHVGESMAFHAASFPHTGGDEAHEDEIRLRIGPLRRHAP